MAQGATVADQTGASVIYVARRGWHTDIGFAAADLAAPLKSLATDFPGVRYLFFGFGDSHYLMAKKQNFPVLLAALWPGPGMILATGLAAPPDMAFGGPHVISLSVTPAQALAAQAFVWKSLLKRNDAAQPYATGPYQGSLYYAASVRYSALHTCNTWSAEALKYSGLPVRTTGVVFAGQFWAQARRLPHAPARAPAPDQSQAPDAPEGFLAPQRHPVEESVSPGRQPASLRPGT
jgi:hypothetical protein